MVRIAAVFVTALALVAPTLASAQQSTNPDYTAVPGPGSSTKGTGYFVIDAEPGENVRQAVDLHNASKRPIEISLAGVDATTGVLGGVSYGIETEPKRLVGSWIHITTSKVRLTPGASKRVPFIIEIPADARQGVNLGGLSVYISEKEKGAAQEERGSDEAGASVVIRTRRILAVQVNLPGAKEPELVVDGVDPAARPDGLYLEIDIANQGTGLTTGTGVVTLPEEDFEREFSIDTFVPGTSIAYPVKWTEAASNGEYEVAVEVEYDGGKSASWEGTFTLGEEVQNELADRLVEPPGTTGEDGGDSTKLLIAAIAGAVLLGMAVTYLLMRRKRT